MRCTLTITRATGLAAAAGLFLTLAACGGARAGAGGQSGPEAAAEEPAGEGVRGQATWYGGRFHGRQTASGEVFDKTELTAAHRELSFGTRVRVTNLENGLSVEVRINDRGPFGDPNRIIDLSRRAAEEIDMIGAGVAPVRVEILD